MLQSLAGSANAPKLQNVLSSLAAGFKEIASAALSAGKTVAKGFLSAAGSGLKRLVSLAGRAGKAFLNLFKTAGKTNSMFGEQVVIAYLCALETEIAAARMIVNGLQIGLPADTIRTRLRELYF